MRARESHEAPTVGAMLILGVSLLMLFGMLMVAFGKLIEGGWRVVRWAVL
jgi:hypothetical protein